MNKIAFSDNTCFHYVDNASFDSSKSIYFTTNFPIGTVLLISSHKSEKQASKYRGVFEVKSSFSRSFSQYLKFSRRGRIILEM